MSELLLLLLDVAFVSTAPAAYIAQAFLQMLLVTLVWEASMHLPHARVALPIPSLNAKIALVIIALASSLVSLRARSLVVAYLNALGMLLSLSTLRMRLYIWLALAGQRNSLLESIVRIIRPAPAAPTTKQTQPPMPQPQVTPFMSAISPPATRATQVRHSNLPYGLLRYSPCTRRVLPCRSSSRLAAFRRSPMLPLLPLPLLLRFF